jgi:regulator of sirC expression with transglutaminase-like and TPR domain
MPIVSIARRQLMADPVLLSATPFLDELQALLDIGEEAHIRLAEAALLIAKQEYPTLDIRHYLDYLDELALRVLTHVTHTEIRPNLILALNHILFEEEGFVGSMADTLDPRNSYLNQVLDRKEGQAVSLAIIYLEVGWRIGLPLEGVAFPGHFLIKMSLGENNLVVIDPTNGVALTADILMNRLYEATGKRNVALLNHLLSGVGRRDIFLYMLDSLRQVYFYQQQWRKLLHIDDALLVVKPSLHNIWRERAEICRKLECFHWALDSYRHYRDLAQDEDEDESPYLEAQIDALEQRLRTLN